MLSVIQFFEGFRIFLDFCLRYLSRCLCFCFFLGDFGFFICSCLSLVFFFSFRFLGFLVFIWFFGLPVVCLCSISHLFFWFFLVFLFLFDFLEVLAVFVLFVHSGQIGSLGLFSNAGDHFKDSSCHRFSGELNWRASVENTLLHDWKNFLSTILLWRKMNNVDGH